MILEYLASDVLDLADGIARDDSNICIIPQHLKSTICDRMELRKVPFGMTGAQDDALPNIQAVLLK